MTENASPKSDFYIRLPSRNDLHHVFSDFLDDSGDGDVELITHTHSYAIDVVGKIFKPTGNMLTDDDGFEYPELAPIDGFHINIRLLNDDRRADFEKIDEKYGVSPSTLYRVWA